MNYSNEEQSFISYPDGDRPTDKEIDDFVKKIKISKDITIQNLKEENKCLKERIEYLERSIVRKEDTIIDLEQKGVPYTNIYTEDLEKTINTAIEYIKNIQNRTKPGEPTVLFRFETNELLRILQRIDINKAKQSILKMIASGDIPKEVYNKYLSNTPIGFMNEQELTEYLERNI